MGETQKPKFTKLRSNGIRKHPAFSSRLDESVTDSPPRSAHVKSMSPRQPHCQDSKIKTSPAFRDAPVSYDIVSTDEHFERKGFEKRLTSTPCKPLDPSKCRPFSK
jgi:hypothetical protein